MKTKVVAAGFVTIFIITFYTALGFCEYYKGNSFSPDSIIMKHLKRYEQIGYKDIGILGKIKESSDTYTIYYKFRRGGSNLIDNMHLLHLDTGLWLTGDKILLEQ